MSQGQLPADHAERQRALSPTESFICEAPAGSGKTELLTQRFLSLLVTVDKPEQIWAITFTKKAAAEMRSRIISAIRMGKQSEPPGEAHKVQTWEIARAVIARDAEYQWQLLNNPNRLIIKTFDGLCRSLTQALPLMSHFGGQPDTAEDPEPLYRQAARNLLATLETESDYTEAIAVVLQQLDNDMQRVENFLVTILYSRTEWLPLLFQGQDPATMRAYLESHLEGVILESLQRVKQLIPSPLQQQLVAMADYAGQNLPASAKANALEHCIGFNGEPEASFAHLDYWLGLSTLLLTDQGKWRKTFTARLGFPTKTNKIPEVVARHHKDRMRALLSMCKATPGLETALDDLRHLPAASYSDEQWALLNALTQILPVLAAHLSLVFSETQQVDFTEVAHKASAALGSANAPSELALKLDYQLRHLLVDEFQDTNTAQIDLIDKLTEGWQPGDGRTLFCVGDAMQSIYAFRGANVGLFLNCIEQGTRNVALTPLRLTTNFRSQAGIVNWINQVFSRAFPAANDPSSGAVSYSPSTPFLERTPRPVMRHGFPNQENGVEEARRVANIIYHTKTHTSHRDIAILVRNKAHVIEITAFLQKVGITYRAVELESLAQSTVIRDLLTLTQALLHPAERTAWLAILRAPWCGLLLDDLETIATFVRNDQTPMSTIWDQMTQVVEIYNYLTDRKHSPQQIDILDDTAPRISPAYSDPDLSASGKARLQRVIDVLKKAQAERSRLPLREWIESTWVALGGPACVRSSDELTNAGIYFDLLEQLEAKGTPTFSAISQAVGKLFAAPDPNADDSVQVMTIHKSKGLEFDVVILPSLHKGSRTDDPELLVWNERLTRKGEPALVIAPIAARAAQQRNSTYDYIRKETSKKQSLEDCRLLYVAATRARHQLHLLANLDINEKTGVPKKPGKKSLLYPIWPAVANHFPLVDPKDHEPLLIPEKQMLIRLVDGYTPPVSNAVNLVADYVLPPVDSGTADNRPDLGESESHPRLIGTLIHFFLEHLVGWQARWLVEYVQKLRPNIRARLSQSGLPSTVLEDATDTVITCLQNCILDMENQWLFDPSLPTRQTELAVTLRKRNGQHDNFIIDHFLVDTANQPWVIDYKTSEPDNGEELKTFLAHEETAYRFQLSRYRMAMEQLGYPYVRSAIYFPKLQLLHEVKEKDASNMSVQEQIPVQKDLL